MTMRYRVTFTTSETPRVAAITNHGAPNPDGSRTTTVALSDGYSTFEDIRKILAVSFANSNVAAITVLSLELVR